MLSEFFGAIETAMGDVFPGKEYLAMIRVMDTKVVTLGLIDPQIAIDVTVKEEADPVLTALGAIAKLLEYYEKVKDLKKCFNCQTFIEEEKPLFNGQLLCEECTEVASDSLVEFDQHLRDQGVEGGQS
jgi:hypothetical protein